jgi:hypothetical protein
MAELEFLPAWYPQARWRRRLLHIQVWSAVALFAGLGLWFALVRRNVATAKASLASVEVQLAQSQLELGQLQEQLQLKSQLEFQRQIVSRLGMPLEMSRLLRTLDALMPKEMSLVELSFDTDEQVRPQQKSAIPTVAATPVASSPPTATNAPPELDRRLSVRLVGVAPSGSELTNFLTGLTGVPFFENVTMNSKDKTQNGHLMREFEVTFSLNLNRCAVSG